MVFGRDVRKKRFIAHVGIVNGIQKSRMKKSTSENRSASFVEIDGVEDDD